MPDRPEVWVSVGQTVNLGNFSNVKLDMGVSKVPFDATPEEIQNIVEHSVVTAFIAMNNLANRMQQKIEELYPNRPR